MILEKSYLFVCVYLIFVFNICCFSQTKNYNSTLNVNVNYYGINLDLPIDSKLINILDKKIRLPKINGRIKIVDILEIYNKLEQGECSFTIDKIKEIKSKLHLNDFDLALLVYKFSNELSFKNENTSVLLQWYLLFKMGYDVCMLIHLFDNTLILMLGNELAFEEVDCIWVTFDYNNKTYISLTYKRNPDKDFYISEVYPIDVYENYLINERKLFEVSRNISIDFPFDTVKNTLMISYYLSTENREVFDSINILYNKNIIDYHNDLSMPAYYDTLYNYEMDSFSLAYLKKEVNPYINLNNNNFLYNIKFLANISRYLNYSWDSITLGFERYNFPIVSLTGEPVDCEDKALLTAYLLWEFLGIESLLVFYKTHINIAIKLDIIFEEGTYLEYEGEKYLIYETTGFANLGMPFELDCKPTFIKLY